MLPEPVEIFAFSPTPSTVMSPEPEAASRNTFSGALYLIVDADVAQVSHGERRCAQCCPSAQWRMSRDLAHLLVACAPT